MERANEYLDALGKEIRGRTANPLYLPGGGETIRSGEDRRKTCKMGFWQSGCLLPRLHFGDPNHHLPKTAISRTFSGETINNRIPTDKKRTGFLSPEYFAAELSDKAQRSRSHLAECDDIRWKVKYFTSLYGMIRINRPGFFGGVNCHWVGEDQEFQDVEPDVRQVSLYPKKCRMFVHATRELVEDAGSLSAVIGEKLPFAIAQTVDESVISMATVSESLWDI